MSEECTSGNAHNEAPSQHQSHSTNTVMYLIASSLNPHNMRYVMVDTDLYGQIIKNDSKYCHQLSCEDKVQGHFCKEIPASSPQSEGVSVLGLPCGFVNRRNSSSGVNKNLTACTTTDNQVIWSNFNNIQNTSMNVRSNAGNSVSPLFLNNESKKVKNCGCVSQCLPPSEQNLVRECQEKSLYTNLGIAKCFCSFENSAENTQKGPKIFSQQEKESVNSHGGQKPQQHLDGVFLKLKTCRCRVCGQCFMDVFSLNFHIYKEHEKTASPTCVRCSAKFVTLYALFRHLMKHKRLLLKQKTKITRELQASLPSCNSKSNFSCFDLNRIQPLTKALNGNIQNLNHDIHRTFPCGECGKEYKHKKTLMAHVKFKHLGVQKKTYKCGFCLRLFSSSWQKNNHLSWRHLGRKPYICQFCNQGFVCLPTLKRHQRKIHTEEKPYKCLHCGQSFFEKTHLDLHKAQIHTGVFPFVCNQCGRGFVQHCYLKNHWKIHSGHRPYKCLICGKNYSKISHLKRHKISCCKKSEGKTLNNASHVHVK